MSLSAIEWTDATHNTVTGCDPISPGCEHCYAALMSRRLKAMGVKKYRNEFEVTLHPEVICEPLKWKKPRNIFLNSMSDSFNKSVPFEFIDQNFAMMLLADHHFFFVLTKRIDRAAEYLSTKDSPLDDSRRDIVVEIAQHQGGVIWDSRGNDPANYVLVPRHGDVSKRRVLPKWPLPNVIIGTSIENQRAADLRREHLRAVSDLGWKTFVSYEPALGPVDWDGWEFIDWMVCGGESGPNSRPMHTDWARSARDFCETNAIPFFFKQVGEWKVIYHRDLEDPDWRDVPTPNPTSKGPRERWLNIVGGHGFHNERVVLVRKVPKREAGRLLDGCEWNEMPPGAIPTD